MKYTYEDGKLVPDEVIHAEFDDFGKYGKLEWRKMESELNEDEFRMMLVTGVVKERCEAADERALRLEQEYEGSGLRDYELREILRSKI